MSNQLFRFLSIQPVESSKTAVDTLRSDVAETIKRFPQFKGIDGNKDVPKLTSLGKENDGSNSSIAFSIMGDVRSDFGRPVVSVLGIGTAYRVEETLLGYEFSELAYVENVLTGEAKFRHFRRTDETETTTEQSSEEEVEEVRNLEEHSTAEFARETSESASRQSQLQAGVTISGQYGPVKLTASSSASVSEQEQSAETQSVNFAREIIDTASNRLRTKTSRKKVVRRRSEIRDQTLHILSNASATNKLGLYRHIERVVKVEVKEVGRRLMLEFVIPEPSAAYHESLGQMAAGIAPAELPTSLERLMATEEDLHNWINSGRYASEAAQFGLFDVTPPPQPTAVSESFMIPGEGQIVKPSSSSRKHRIMSVENSPNLIDVPEGYSVRYAQTQVVFSDPTEPPEANERDNDKRDNVYIGLGGAYITLTNRRDLQSRQDVFAKYDGITQGEPAQNGDNVRLHGGFAIPRVPNSDPRSERDPHLRIITANQIGMNAGEIPVVASAFSRTAISFSVTLFVVPSDALLREWAIETHGQIARAREERLAEYEAEQARNKIEKDNAERVFISTLQSREIETEEIKRGCLTLLMGSSRLADPTAEMLNFVGTDGGPIQTSSDPQERVIDADASLMLNLFGDRVRTFEAAFEWENMTFFYLPYFWADRLSWARLRNASHPNADFKQFLRAGAVRVFVPVRPAHTEAVLKALEDETFAKLNVDDARSVLDLATQDLPVGKTVEGGCFYKRVPTDLIGLSENMLFGDQLLEAQDCKGHKIFDPERLQEDLRDGAITFPTNDAASDDKKG